MPGLPSTIVMRELAVEAEALNLKVGEASIQCIAELLAALREFVVEAADTQPGFAKYLTAFDNSVELEMQFLTALPAKMKMELGLTLYARGMLEEMEALHELLTTPLTGTPEEQDKQKEKKKMAATTLKEELGEVWPGWLPSWIETIIESVLALL